ncbi:MAG: hypothetical protein K8M05_37460 [Deltaproteobacteria bacterium]|nr:hypothetical protein [Kofleriaceae bacterium]
MSRRRSVLAVLGVLVAASCGSTEQEQPQIQNLDRPIDAAIACHGNLRITGGDGAQAGDPLVFSPMPLEACRLRTLEAPPDGNPAPGQPGHVPPNWAPGQEDLPDQPELSKGSRWYIFALQSASGTVAVAETTTGVQSDGGGYNNGEINVRDGDLLVPGKNALSVGSLPVAITGDPSGCFMTTANAGSCDLSVLDVDRIISRSSDPLVRKLDVTTPDGMPLLARPAAMIADQRDAEIGVACPLEPQGLLYIAYPNCHAVAVVDAATGGVVSSIRFDAAGNATVGDGNLVCPAECGMREPIADGGRPVTLDLVRDDVSANRRLAIGLDNRPVVTVVDLDATYMPTTVEQYELEGDVGVIDVAITKVINMTGTAGWIEEPPSPLRAAQFVYAVANDGTVRVVETTTRDHECDTQVDPRYTRVVTDARDLICYQPGQVGTPPRRALARSPGIQFPGDDAPLSVVVTEAGVGKSSQYHPAPTYLVGHFALVSSSFGLTYVVNIDDDNYADTENSAYPLDSQLALAMPHQLRDALTVRSQQGPGAGTSPEEEDDDRLCNYPGPFSNGAPVGGPRAEDEPAINPAPASIATVKLFSMPYVRQLECRAASASDLDLALPEVMYANTAEVRDQVFPDLRALRFEETWSFQWEGSLSIDNPSSAVDGPVVRSGKVTIGGGSISVQDAAHPYCAAGIEPYDYVQLRGCDPAQGDRQCGLGETCYVHPDATIATGSCLPTDRVAQLAGACRDFLVSVRRYAVQQATSGQLVMSERRRVLRTTPITGCTSVTQCEQLADYEATLTSDLDPFAQEPQDDARTWACEPDPTRSPGINRCQQTCTESSQCDAGTVCSGGYCIEGTIPPEACVAGLQRYSLHATEAMVAIGTRTGYLHGVTEGAGGQCVKDPNANPLLTGRIPLNVPACTGEGFDVVTPNPCRTTIAHTELVPNYTGAAPPAPTCQIGTPPGVMRTTMVDAIRWKNPLMTLHIVNPTYPGDEVCKYDRGGGLVDVPHVFPGYAFTFRVIAGFSPQTAGGLAILPSKLVRSPDGAVWIIDEGDSDPSAIDAPPTGAPNYRGQIIRVDPDAVASGTVIR